jgi:Kdo2-lipid IVA lauroyltransferase/acyltransferase
VIQNGIRAERLRPTDRIEGCGAVVLFAAFRLLPINWASALGGAVARQAGPLLGISKRARINLRRALPGLPTTEIERIVTGMWDNLGRVAAEYPICARSASSRPMVG